MTTGWQQMKLGDFARLQRGHDLPEQNRRPGAVPILGSFGITGYHDTSKTKGPGVTVGRSGASFGVVSFSPVDFWPLNTALYVTDFNGNDERFTYYFLKSIDFKRYNSGSAQPSLNRNYIHPITVRVPPLPTQRAIAHILGTLDDKIELNRRMNETLEATARAIFKSWFVDFDPVRAKLNGQKPPAMDEKTAALFPDEFEESELGKIPKGWDIQSLQELTSAIGSGATPRGGSKVYIDEGIALVRSQNVYDCEFRWDGLVHITPEAAEALAGVTLEPEDILFNITGASILRTCIVDPAVLPARVNQHVARIRARKPVSSRFLHLHLVRREMKESLIGLNAGATREAITKGHLQSIRLVAPPDKIYAAFDLVVGPVHTQVQNNLRQSALLCSLRDTLLPKLLSGELRVADAEKIVEDVV